MKTQSIKNQFSVSQERIHPGDWLRGLARRMAAAFPTVRRSQGDPEPTVEQIVDRIMALERGEWCEVKLNPQITRIANLKWLLPICVEQFGTKIALFEQPEGDYVVLSMLVTATRSRNAGQFVPGEVPVEKPASELVEVQVEEPARELVEVA
jgi:hypothetical protein